MGIYIKGMDMPTNCTDCCYRPLVGCNPYQDNGLSPSDHRHRTCPLTEVPEPHGRLIDAEVLSLALNLYKSAKGKDAHVPIEEMEEAVDAMKTEIDGSE